MNLLSSIVEMESIEAIINQLPDYVCVKDSTGRWQYANAIARRIFGIRNLEFFGKSDNELADQSAFHKDAFLHCTESDEAVWSSGDAMRRVEQILQPNGEVLFFDTMKLPTFHEDGKRKNLIVIGRDVSQYMHARTELEHSEEKYRLITEHMQDMVAIINAAGMFHYISPSTTEILGYEVEELLGTTAFDKIPDADMDTIAPQLAKLIDTRQPNSIEYRFLHKSGHYVFLETSATPVLSEDGNVSSIVTSSRDISLRKETEMRLEESTQRYQSLFHHNPNAVFSLDLNRRFTSMNAKTLELFGYTVEELIGQPTSVLVLPEDVSQGQRFFSKALQTDYVLEELQIRAKGGNVIDVQVHEMPIFVNGDVVGVFVVAHDISEQKRAAETIERMAYYDMLTGLPNRVLLTERVNDAIANIDTNGGTMCLMFIDLDHFKTVNDTMGHSMGDKLLRQVAQDLSTCIRPEDTLCRLGGDEFIVLLPTVAGIETAVDAANRMMQVFAKPWEVGGQAFYITSSIGITMATDASVDADGLIRRADIAMYHAKDQGKNNYQFFNETLNEKIQKRFEVETALRSAIKNNQLVLYYQPYVDAITQQVAGAEALIRWNRPEYGVVSPGEFIEVAEETGLIIPIGDWVLQTVCLQLREWQLQGYEARRVSVNISPRQFQDERFVDKVRDVLTATGVHGSCLGIEITEGLIVRDADHALVTLTALRDLGIEVSIDDFGTGYSSLNRLKVLPIDRIKIDQSFVRDLTGNEADLAIVKTVIALSKNLGISSIAEGVETSAQVELLSSYECDELQGYFFGKPVPAAEFSRFLTATSNG